MYYYEDCYDTLVGKKFDRLVVQKQADKKNGHVRWECLCDCGKIKIVRGDCLKQGTTKSCGCLVKENNEKMRSQLGWMMPSSKKHGMSHTDTYNIYRGMLQRCYNEKSTGWPHYGALGVVVCDSWRESFDNFYKDMGERPDKCHSLERLVSSDGYNPSNVVWADNTTQSRNRSLFSNNTSGVTGVYRRINHGYAYWVCTTSHPKTNKIERKSFSVLKLGEEEALQKAKEYRLKKIQEYNELFDAGYSSSHGEPK